MPSKNTTPPLQQVDLLQLSKQRKKGNKAPSQVNNSISAPEVRPARDSLTEKGRLFKEQLERDRQRRELRAWKQMENESQVNKENEGTMATVKGHGTTRNIRKPCHTRVIEVEVTASEEEDMDVDGHEELDEESYEPDIPEKIVPAPIIQLRNQTSHTRLGSSSSCPTQHKTNLSCSSALAVSSSLTPTPQGPIAKAIGEKRKKSQPTTGSSSACSNSSNATSVVDHENQSNWPNEEVPTDEEQRPKKRSTSLRLRDLTGDAKKITEAAQREFQIRICTQYAFPEDDDEMVDEWVKECWNNACKQREVSLPMNDGHFTLIRKRTSTIRGRVKNEVIKNMAQSYGFRVVNSDEDRSFNKERATELLRKYAYIYEDSESSRGMYEHPIVQAVINAQFFGDRGKSDGIVYSAAFNPIPEHTIALIFTLVHYSLTEWAAAGVSKPGSQFSEANWHPVYRNHLEGIEKWKAYNDKTARAFARYQQKLFEGGSKNAGFKVITNSDPFEDDDFARAAAALDDE